VTAFDLVIRGGSVFADADLAIWDPDKRVRVSAEVTPANG